MRISLELDREKAQTACGMILQATRGTKAWRKTAATEWLDSWAIKTLVTIAESIERGEGQK